MVPLGAILASMTAEGDHLHVTIPPGWMQGRTTYGGLSSALALEAARRSVPDLPPLRSAQIGFIGPLGDAVTVQATLLRRGRTACFVQVDMVGEAGLGLRALFVFAAPQPSGVAFEAGAAPEVLAPGEVPVPFPPGQLPVFTANFEYWQAQSSQSAVPADLLLWVRLKERAGIDPHVALLAVGDALPPAALLLARQPGPTSSINWTLNFPAIPPETADGWWLLRSSAHHAHHGGSSQTMAIWNRQGDMVAAAMQSVALFC